MSTIKVNTITTRSGSTVTLGESGKTIALACGASQSGFGRTGTVDWQTTVKTSTFTAVSGEGYFVNTTGGAITMNLPAGVANAIVSVADYAGTFQTNSLTITPNGSDKLGGANASKTLVTEGQSITLVYVDSTQGWINTMDSTSNVRGEAFICASGGTETTSGDFKIHTFNSDATFTVNSVGIGPVGTKVSYLVVAGGGGSSQDRSGGGGAGGFREGKQACDSYTASPLATTGLTVSAQAYPITIGAGGALDNSPPFDDGGSGGQSVFSTITSAGGGGGGKTPGTGAVGVAGGSGGGAGSVAPHTGRSGGAGNTPPVSPPQGNPGGSSANSSPGYATGGGGGATVAGGDGSGPCAGAGGAGATSSINATPTARAGGGGGGSDNAGDSGAGGTGGGGAGGTPPSAAVAGGTNTGGGAGGTSGGSTGVSGVNGGSGVVIIRYKYQ